MGQKLFFLFGVLVLGTEFFAQGQDTTKRKTIEITSSFKPVLRDAVKINFNAAPPVADTSRPRLTYNIPSQYLFLSYQPGEMKPVALPGDTLKPWENYNYIKVGAGNVALPFVQTGFSFGDGKTKSLNIFANQLNSKGNLPFQKNSLTDVKLMGTLKNENNQQWDASLGFKNDLYYLYGFRPDTLKYDASQLKQAFQTFEGKLSFRNTEPTEFGLIYHPNIQVDVFTDNHSPSASETNTVLNLPLEKSFGKTFGFNLGITADLTHYSHVGGPNIPSSQNNNLYFVTPAFLIKTPNLYLQASVIPSWDNSDFHLLPNFTANISTNDQRFTLLLGWLGRYEKGSYQRFESINPWLAQPITSSLGTGFLPLLTTRIQEWFAGFKGSLNNHFTYAAKASFLEYKNMPLFVNDDTLDGGKRFDIRYETYMRAVQMHGEVSYIQGEDFSATAGVNLIHYSDLKTESKAWGLLPREFTANLKWQAFKDFWAKIDLYAFDGAQYRAGDGAGGYTSFKGDGAVDLNAGVEMKITRQLNLWFQMNNLFNKKYERWHQYQVYGFNVLGGVVFSFGQK